MSKRTVALITAAATFGVLHGMLGFAKDFVWAFAIDDDDSPLYPNGYPLT